MIHNYENRSNSEISNAIDEWIHSERDRIILKKKLIDGYTYQQISDFLFFEYKIDLKERQVKNIVYKTEAKLFKHF